jgi:RNA polymerase sigma-70 factor (ECF subfamily)
MESRPPRQLFARSSVGLREDQDASLISSCRRGDRDALGELVSRYEKPVFNAAYRMLGNRTEASDVTQNVFLKVFEHLDGYEPKFRFFSWIYRIALNESIDQLQRRQRLELPGGDEFIDNQAASTTSGPDDLVDASQMHDFVQAALMELQQDYRAVIVLRHFADCSYEQMAEILHVPEKTVKSRLYSARQAMKEKLSARGIERT